jgi:hypothetical protein
MLNNEVSRIFGVCFPAIGGEEHQDVRFVLHERPVEVTRNSFFNAATWAISGSGISRASNAAFCNRMTECGFPWDWQEFAGWPRSRREQFYARLYPRGISGRGGMKSAAIEEIAGRLGRFESEAAFQAEFFGGKTRSADLNRDDVRRLRVLRLRFIGPANSAFVVRNMGGEALKCDRWILTLLDYLGVSGSMLEEALASSGISLALFDIVIWAYCERFVQRVADFRSHFDRLLSRLK